MKIPLAQPDISELEKKYVLDAVQSTWISSTGKYVMQFEEKFAELCGTRTSISVCNGTVALHLALMALDVRPGDEVNGCDVIGEVKETSIITHKIIIPPDINGKLLSRFWPL